MTSHVLCLLAGIAAIIFYTLGMLIAQFLIVEKECEIGGLIAIFMGLALGLFNIVLMFYV